jgi:hypothetical protein
LFPPTYHFPFYPTVPQTLLLTTSFLFLLRLFRIEKKVESGKCKNKDLGFWAVLGEPELPLG